MDNQLNNKDFLNVFHLIVEEGGLNDFLTLPKRKDSLNYSFPEVDGLEIDLAEPAFEARQFRLKCLFSVSGTDASTTKVNFWQIYNGLFTELGLYGTHELYLKDLDKTFIVYYKEQQSVSKIQFKDNVMSIKFELIFGEANPYDNINKVYLVDENDRYLIA